MSKTRAELVNRALANLGALPAGQTVNPEEFNQVDAQVLTLADNLAGRDIYYLADATNIADEAFIPLGHCLAWACAAEFGVHGDAALAALSQQAEMQLKVLASEPPSYRTLEILAW